MSYDIQLGMALKISLSAPDGKAQTLQEVPTGVTELHMGIDFSLSLWTLIFAKQMGWVSTHL